MENRTLQHHGILGMKWGVRRYQNKDGSLTSAGKKHRSIGQTIKDYKTNKVRKKNLEKARVARVEKKQAAEQRARDLKAGKIKAKDMTDDELRTKIARLEMEKQYKDLSRDTETLSRGKKFINKFLDSTSDKVADNVLADLAAQALKAGLATAVNEAAKKEIVYSNNKKKS